MVTKNFDWLTTDIVVTMWRGTPDYDQTDETISEIIARGLGSVLGHSLPVTAKSVALDGSVQTNQVVIPTTSVGEEITWFTLSRRAVSIDNSSLIYFVDQCDFLPFTTNGLDIVVNPDWTTQRGWFRV